MISIMISTATMFLLWAEGIITRGEFVRWFEQTQKKLVGRDFVKVAIFFGGYKSRGLERMEFIQ